MFELILVFTLGAASGAGGYHLFLARTKAKG